MLGYSAENLLNRKDMVFVTKAGDNLCAKDASRYVQGMVRRSVSGFIVHGNPVRCDLCGKEIKPAGA